MKSKEGATGGSPVTGLPIEGRTSRGNGGPISGSARWRSYGETVRRSARA